MCTLHKYSLNINFNLESVSPFNHLEIGIFDGRRPLILNGTVALACYRKEEMFLLN